MNNNLKKTGWALLIALTFFACKKEQKQENLQDDAKSWYLKNNNKTVYTLVSNKYEILKVNQQTDWANAQSFQLTDGTEVLGVPLSFKLVNGKSANGSYMLMISRDGDSFKKQTVYNEEKEFFKNISKEKIQSAYDQANQLMALQKRANSNPGKGKIMSEDNGGGMSDQPVCVNWYLVETYRDESGQVTAVVETFLYQSCTTGPSNGGPGNGGNENSDERIDLENLGYPVSIDNGTLPETENIVGIDTFRISQLHWTYYNGITFRFTSHEKGTVKIKNGIRRWEGLSHIAQGKDGGWLLGKANPVEFKATPHLNTNSSGTSWMDIDYKIEYEVITGTTLPSYTTRFKNSVGVWDTNFDLQ